MTKRNYLLLLSLTILAVSITLIKLNRNTTEIEFESSNFEGENEERPDEPVMTDEERALFMAYLEKRQNQIGLKAAPTWGESSYAGGKLQGTWSPKVTRSGWHGYRVDNSAFDSLRNVFYVVTYAGHLYKLEYQDSIKWTLLNHKIVLNPPSNSQANPVFIGTLLPDSTFRLIRSYDDLNRMEYSDDEGKTWHISTGANVSQSWSNQAFEITNNGQKRIILHTYHSDYHRIYFSNDNGETYTEKHTFHVSSSDMRIVKPYYTNEAFMLVWSKSSKKTDIYKYNSVSDDFELKTNSSSIVAGTNLSNAQATYYDGSYHFYLGTYNSGQTVYYSADTGTTWVEKNSGRDRTFEIMCADKPNILISGFEDMKLSTDYGTTWSGYGWRLGWDLQHLRTFEMSGGKHITLAGLDFGCYISETPEDKESYIWCNNGAWYAMHYDAVTSENFNSVYLGNQDRGTTAYSDAGTYVNTIDVDGTDVLRVCLAKHETSVWTWFYYGRIKHRYNFPTGKSGAANYDGLGNWWAASIIASPDPSEDAIYAAYGSNLQKFTFNPKTNTISKTAHPYNFKTKFGEELGGFGYSELNRNLWYVALKNGYFIYSKDGGQSWTGTSYTGSKPYATTSWSKENIVIKASSIDVNKVYYAGIGNKFLISENNGKNFTNKTNGLSVYRIRDFTLSPDEKFVFAACGYGGAWVYSVDDDYWYQMSDDPIPSVDFTDVQFIHGKNCVRFSTYGSGVLDFTLNNSFYAVNAPQSLNVAWTYPNHVELNWTDNSANEDGFYIERATDYDFVRIDTIGPNTTVYVDSSVGYNQTCYYRVKAFKNDSASFKSNLAYVNIPDEGFISKDNWKIISYSSDEVKGEYAPVKYAIDNKTTTYWHTEWKDNQPAHPHFIAIDLGQESMVSGFRYLPRQNDNNLGNVKNYEFYVTNDTSDWGTPVASGQFNTDSDWKEVIFSQTSGRYIKFVALSEVNGNFFSCTAEISVLYKHIAPDAPNNLSITQINDFDAQLVWADNSINESGFIIEQLIDGDFVVIDSVDSPTTSFVQPDLKPDSTYWYRVMAYNDVGTSEPTDTTSISVVEPIPDKPTGLTALLVSDLDVQLTWTDNSNNELGFIIEQLIDVNFVAIDTVDSTSTSYIRHDLEPGSTITFRVRAYNSTGMSASTSTAISIPIPIPDAPTDFTASLVNDFNVKLTWTDNANNELGYIIEQLIGDDFAAIDTVDSTSSSYIRYDLEPNTTFWYRVRAYNNYGMSTPTGIANVTTKNSSVLYVQNIKLKVFPNPCTNYLKIELSPLNQRATLKIIDLNGKTIIQKNIDSGSSLINLTLGDIPDGIYIVELSSDNIRIAQKLRKD